MTQGKDQQKGHAAVKETSTHSAATPSKDSTLCTEHNKDKALCAGLHHTKPVTGTHQKK
jgi:hypothetical protein